MRYIIEEYSVNMEKNFRKFCYLRREIVIQKQIVATGQTKARQVAQLSWPGDHTRTGCPACDPLFRRREPGRAREREWWTKTTGKIKSTQSII